MGFPQELNEALEQQLKKNIKLEHIDKSAKEISKRYRLNDNDGKRLLTKTDEAIAYALSRMPATYEAVFSTINRLNENNNYEFNSVLDVGAGTGAATWAIYNFLGCNEYTCLEREKAMMQIGKELMNYSEDLKNTIWKEFDIVKDEITVKSDLVIVSYMINELQKCDIDNIINKLWNATNKVLVILEPGTPKGYSNIAYIRSKLLMQGGHIIAPCPHENKCEIEKNDWCHFTCRIQRSKTHKKLKDGQAPYEDEKFSYIIFSKKQTEKSENRILRHPIINKGYAEFKICTNKGIKNIRLSKKDGEIYKNAKKQNAGDILKMKNRGES